MRDKRAIVLEEGLVKKMDNKDNILDAWITVEQFSEGDISTKDRNYKILDEKAISYNYTVEKHGKLYIDWKSYFLDEIETFIDKEKIRKDKQREVGLIMYFGIFDFSEVIKIIREIYNISDTFEELKNGSKFTLSISFDRNLKLVPDKLFLTMAGYVRQNKEIPRYLLEIENSLKDELEEKFEENGFQAIFEAFKTKYRVNKENFRMMIVRNLENSNADMHSFFIDDLRKAKRVATDNLERYMNGFSDRKFNLDSDRNSIYFKPGVFYSILQPKYYPMGRFPSDSSFALSFMQQVAVNLYLYDSNNMLGVNGPPGTGKTTLLKEIFADLIVRQAKEMCNYIDSPLKEGIRYFEKAKIPVISEKISKYNILVASSNNGAVQNIVRDLPLKKEIGQEFITDIEGLDYFTFSSCSEITKVFNKENNLFEYIPKPKEEMVEKNWGLFSAEGGASANVTKLLNTIGSILDELNQWDLPEENEESILVEFNLFYQKVNNYKNKMQDIFDQYKEIEPAKEKLLEAEDKLKEEEARSEDIEKTIFEKAKIIKALKKEFRQIHEEQKMIDAKLSSKEGEVESAKRNFEVIRMQKPPETFWQWIKEFLGIYNRKEYFDRLNQANELLNQREESYCVLLSEKNSLEIKLHDIERKTLNLNGEIKKIRNEYQGRINILAQKVLARQKRLSEIEKTIKKVQSPSIDFALNYEDLQKSNPWSTKDFRIMQTNLFISALKIRKLFLYKNRKHLKAAMNIFDRQKEYIGKENGKLVIKTAWEWINLAIPVVSSTFASFGRMFRFFDQESLGSLFIDEAGQALPQASVGSIFRSSKVMALGDPSQIKPVLTLDSEMMNIISRKYNVSETFVSNDVSTQSLIDRASQYGFFKSEEEWIGIPLWVHRRSKDPMFSISNSISYNNLMVQGKSLEETCGEAFWYDVKGNAVDKYVEEQGDKLVELIEEKLKENPDLKSQIYVITPFRNVAYRLSKRLDKIQFTIYDVKRKPTNVGTVHTFQGKEAKIVYFVLGADEKSQGAARWAFSQPNIVNVAVTRAKEEFYVIGDKKLYSKLESKVATQTIKIIDEYNNVEMLRKLIPNNAQDVE